MATRILIIDDDPAIREILSWILIAEGYEVQSTGTPVELAGLIGTFRPDLLLLDLNLGDTDGREICRALKADPATADLPVIIISAAPDLSADQLSRYGADDHLSKPFTLPDVIGKVSYFSAPAQLIRSAISGK